MKDVVGAYKLLLEKGKNGEVYNICSGQERKIGDLLEILLNIAGVKAEIQQDTKKYRKSEQTRMVGSYEKLNRETGWKPNIQLETSLREILDSWEGKIS